jgi:hypothetical protein
MKRLRVSDIEALLGPAATARLVEGVKENQGKRKYKVTVYATFSSPHEIEAKSAEEARRVAEHKVRDLYAQGDNQPEIRSRIELIIGGGMRPMEVPMPIEGDEEYPLDGVAIEEQLDDTPTRAEDTNKPKAKGPGSVPRPKRQPRPSRG